MLGAASKVVSDAADVWTPVTFRDGVLEVHACKLPPAWGTTVQFLLK
jgi:hypothetical protein